MTPIDTSAAATQFVDLKTYPIDQPGAPEYAELLARCRSDMRGGGACLLQGFVPEGRRSALVSDTESLAELAHHNTNKTTTPYQTTVPADKAGRHPTRKPRKSSVHVLAYDLIPPGHGIRMLYEWDVLRRFLADVLELPDLHRYEDPLAGLNIAVNMRGDRNGWHFDQCDFVTSVLIRPAAKGGLFQYCPNIRSASDENYPGVQAVLEGDETAVKTLAFAAGDLAIFKGRHSMHRVTTIESETPRLVALLGYDSKPGVTMTDEAKMRRFGRVN